MGGKERERGMGGKERERGGGREQCTGLLIEKLVKLIEKFKFK